MKVITILFLLLLASPAFGELTKEDIRTIVKEENDASEKRLKEYIDLKIDGVEKSLNARINELDKSLNARIDAVHTRIDAVDKRIDELEESLSRRIGDMWLVVLALIGLVAATIAIPQIIVAYRDRGRRELQAEIQQLRERLEALENTPS